MEAAGLKRMGVPDDFLLGRALAHAVVDTDTGEVLASANDELTEELLEKLRAAKVDAFRTIYTNDLDQGSYISQTLRIDETVDQLAARVAIYRMMRPGEPPTEDAVESLFNGLFYAEERYDLIIPLKYLDDPKVQKVLNLIRTGDEFHKKILALGGYSLRDAGNIMYQID